MRNFYSSRRMGALLATAALFALSALSRAVPDKSGIDYAALIAAVDDLNSRLVKVRGAVDQTRFDPEEWLTKLDYDDATIVQAVADEIAFEPYAGVLRGVAGTLRARAGNSVDQALLLASLLKSAGFDARIVRATLPEDDARSLLLSLQPSDERPESLGYLEPEMQSEFGKGATVSPADVDWKSSALAQRSKKAADLLLDTLQSAGVAIAMQDVTQDLLAQTRDYFWVQYRDGPSDAWKDEHPAFASKEAPPDLKAEEYFAESIPAKYQHRLTISAWLRQKSAGKLQDVRLMNDFTRPIANLQGIALDYRNHPTGLTPATLGDVGKAISDTQLLLPTFNGALAPGAQAFDLKGRVVDPMAMQSPAAGLFATLGDKMDKATATTIEPGSDKSVFSLDSMWLEFRFSSPDGKEYSTRRYLLPPGSDADAKTKIWPLITENTYLVNAGLEPLDFLADRYLASGIAGTDYYKALAHKFIRPNDGTPLPKGNLPLDFGPLAQFRFMDSNPHASKDERRFRGRPSLVGIRHGFRDANTAFIGVDVVANALADLKVDHERIVHDATAAVRRGVWDTTVEAVPTLNLRVAAKRRANAVDVILNAKTQGIALQVIKPGSVQDVDKVTLSPSAALLVREELKRGYTIVVPVREPDGVAMSGWWRVNATTGETLGMTADGYGQDVVEYLTEVFDTGLGMVNAVKSLKDCDEKPTDVKRMCCLVEANINNVAGLGFGGAMGSLVGTAGGALFSIVDYGTAQATQAAFGESHGLMPAAALGCDQLPDTQW